MKPVYKLFFVLFTSLFSTTVIMALDREDCGTYIGSYAVAGENRPESLPEEIRVYPLHIGDTLVPYEQFYGGLELSGFGGTLKLINSEKFLWVPIYMFLIDHPVVGPFLIDSGVNSEMVYNYDEYFAGSDGFVSRLMEEEYVLQPEQEIFAQLALIGYTPQDIELIVLTHTHDDHVGGLPYFQHARIVLSQAEFEIVDFVTENTQFPVNIQFYEGVTCWEPISYTDGEVYSFSTSQDLLGDGSVILLPTPGHSAGSLSVLVNMGDYQLLLPGDTAYTMRHLDPTQVFQFIPDTEPEITIESINKLNQLRTALSDVVVVTSHDHTGYLETVLASLITCGWLNEDERAQVALYEELLFDEDGFVRRDFVPEYISADDGSKYGDVSGIDLEIDYLPACQP